MLKSTTPQAENNDKNKILFGFIEETKSGVYTGGNPEIVSVTYGRSNLEEASELYFDENVNGDILLFGISF